jgi:prenyltransferase/squalene oxidase-like repeat protein
VRPLTGSCIAALLIVASHALDASAQTEPPSMALDDRTAAAVDRGLAYLVRTQEAIGSWRGIIGRKVHVRYVGHEGHDVGVTALAGLSLLARLGRDGATAEHRLAAERALRWICGQVRDDGFIAADGSRMYGHAFATLFLARACRSELGADLPVKEKLEKAAGLIVGAQNAEGGWRYLPGSNDSDLSVTACQLVALRASRAAGIEVPEDALRRGLDYVKSTYKEVFPVGGVFRYQIATTAAPSRYSFALTAAGLLVLAEAGESSSNPAREALAYLLTYPPPPEGAKGRFDYYYGHHFAMSALRFEEEERFLEWHLSVESEFLALQEADGSWVDLVGPAYATAMATLVLQEPALAGESSSR